MPSSKHARYKRTYRDFHADDDDYAEDSDSLTSNDFVRRKKLVHSSLVEIDLDSWQDLSQRLEAVRSYLLINFGEIGCILPDPMMFQRIPAYNADENIESDYLSDVENLSESTDPTGLKRLIAVERLNGRMERSRQYLRNRVVAYWTIRSVTSRMLDQALSADPEFHKIEVSDPIALYQLIKKIVMTRHTEKNKSRSVERPVATPMMIDQNFPIQRTTSPQIMYGALMYVTHGTSHTFLITVTLPLGIILVAGIDSISTPVLRNTVNRMFGVFVSRGIQIAQFVSDNEKGLSSLFGDSNPLNIEMVTSGLGEYANRIEAVIRVVKDAVRRSCFYVPFILSHEMFKLLVVSVTKRINFFDMVTPGRETSPFHGLMGRKVDGIHDVGPAIFTYCEIKDRCSDDFNVNRTVEVLYVHPHQTGEGTHLFLRLDNQQLVTAKHYREVPVTAEVIAHVNAWSDPRKVHHYTVPRFICHGQEVLSNDDDNNDDDVFDQDENANENEDDFDDIEDDTIVHPVSEQNNSITSTIRTHNSVSHLVTALVNVIDSNSDDVMY